MTKVEETKSPRDLLIESLEHTMSSVGLDIQERAVEIAGEALPHLVLGALGIETDRWGRGRFKLDRCNGFVGVMAQCIADLAQENAHRHGPALVKRFLKKAAERDAKSLSKASDFTREIRNEYRSQYLKTLEEIVTAEISRDVESMKMSQEAEVRASVEGINEIFSPENSFFANLVEVIRKGAGDEIADRAQKRLGVIIRPESEFEDDDEEDYDEEESLLAC